MGVLPACIFVYHKHAWCPLKPEESNMHLGTGVTHSHELPCGFWEWSPCPLEEQTVLLNPETSLQPSTTSLHLHVTIHQELQCKIKHLKHQLPDYLTINDFINLYVLNYWAIQPIFSFEKCFMQYILIILSPSLNSFQILFTHLSFCVLNKQTEKIPSQPIKYPHPKKLIIFVFNLYERKGALKIIPIKGVLKKEANSCYETRPLPLKKAITISESIFSLLFLWK